MDVEECALFQLVVLLYQKEIVFIFLSRLISS